MSPDQLSTFSTYLFFIMCGSLMLIPTLMILDFLQMQKDIDREANNQGGE